MSPIVCFLLFLSLHACSARLLQVNTVERKGGSVKLSAQEKISTTDEYLRLRNDKMGVRIIEGKTLASENIMQQKLSEELGERNGEKIGKNTALSSSDFKPHIIKVEDEKRQEARKLESLPSDNAEESVGAKGNDMGEDIDVMDYAQPHRKPPIHNKD